MEPKNILSTAAQNAMPSGVRRMFELAKRYPDAINLTLGEPGFATPDYIINAGILGLKEKKTKYTPNAGIYFTSQSIYSNTKIKFCIIFIFYKY